jgi:hypothetical protein
MSDQSELEAHNAERAAQAAHDDEMWEKVARDTKDLGCPSCAGEERYGWVCPKCVDGLFGTIVRLSAAKRQLEAELGALRSDVVALKAIASESTSANVWAYAYNAAVNYGSERAHKKMLGLIEALNRGMRDEGRKKLQALVDAGVVESCKPCPPECHMRPGGLFHAEGCENDPNYPVYKARTKAAEEKLTGGPDGWAGWRAASVKLVGGAA